MKNTGPISNSGYPSFNKRCASQAGVFPVLVIEDVVPSLTCISYSAENKMKKIQCS